MAVLSQPLLDPFSLMSWSWRWILLEDVRPPLCHLVDWRLYIRLQHRNDVASGVDSEALLEHVRWHHVPLAAHDLHDLRALQLLQNVRPPGHAIFVRLVRDKLAPTHYMRPAAHRFAYNVGWWAPLYIWRCYAMARIICWHLDNNVVDLCGFRSPDCGWSRGMSLSLGRGCNVSAKVSSSRRILKRSTCSRSEMSRSVNRSASDKHNIYFHLKCQNKPIKDWKTWLNFVMLKTTHWLACTVLYLCMLSMMRSWWDLISDEVRSD